jgi:hypothetical protein
MAALNWAESATTVNPQIRQIVVSKSGEAPYKYPTNMAHVPLIIKDIMVIIVRPKRSARFGPGGN